MGSALWVFRSVTDAYPRIVMLRHDGREQGKVPDVLYCLRVVLGTM
jgi:hypothetical protein